MQHGKRAAARRLVLEVLRRGVGSLPRGKADARQRGFDGHPVVLVRPENIIRPARHQGRVVLLRIDEGVEQALEGGRHDAPLVDARGGPVPVDRRACQRTVTPDPIGLGCVEGDPQSFGILRGHPGLDIFDRDSHFEVAKLEEPKIAKRQEQDEAAGQVRRVHRELPAAAEHQNGEQEEEHDADNLGAQVLHGVVEVLFQVLAPEAQHEQANRPHADRQQPASRPGPLRGLRFTMKEIVEPSSGEQHRQGRQGAEDAARTTEQAQARNGPEHGKKRRAIIQGQDHARDQQTNDGPLPACAPCS